VIVLTKDFASYDDVTALMRGVAAAAYAIPVDRLSATLETVKGIAVKSGDPATLLITVTNTSNFTWPAGGTTPVHLGYHWIGNGGQTLVWDGARTARFQSPHGHTGVGA